MPADFSDYVDLIPYDLSPTDVYLGAIQLGRIALPEFELRQGTPDDAMLQAFSYITALNVGAINRLPPRLMEGIVSLMGLSRDGGLRATVSANITLNGYDRFVLPIGSVFTHTQTSSTGSVVTQYETLEPVAVEASEAEDEQGNENPFPTETILLAASYVGVVPSVIVGDVMQSQTIVVDVDTVLADPNFVNGANPEDPAYYLTRARTYLQSLSANTSTARQIEAFILTGYNYIRRCKAYDLTDPDASLFFSASDKAGYTTIFVWGLESGVSTDRLYDLLIAVSDKSTAGLNFNILNFTTVNVGVNVSAVYDPAYAEADVADSIKASLYSFLSPNGFTSKAERVKVSELSTLVSSVPGVEYVVDVSINDVDSLVNQASPIISVDTNGDIVFLRKGILASSDENNFVVSLTSS
jgi:hypothetical protein